VKLTDLNPSFIGAGGPGISTRTAAGELEPVPARHGVGLSLDCPCGCGVGCYVPFANPLDGGPQYDAQGWQRTGDTFETLTLSPSIQRLSGCKWHGFIRNGEIITC
jgi:hypothetical protein